MIKKILQWVGIVLGVLVGIMLIAAVGIYIASESILNKHYEVQATSIDIPTDDASIERGEYLVTTHFCTDCHGDDLGGNVVFDEDNIGTLYAPNLTEAAERLTPEGWDLAVRHGVREDGEALYLMTASDYYHFTDDDMAAIAAYVRSVPRVDREVPEPSYGPIGRFGMVVGMFPPPDAERIDHDAPREDVEQGITAEYGEYLAQVCTGCHGIDFAGQPIPGLDYSAPNIHGGGGLAGWTEEDFINAIRTGQTPDGVSLDPAKMPWPIVARMTDDDLKAIFAYLLTLE